MLSIILYNVPSNIKELHSISNFISSCIENWLEKLLSKRSFRKVLLMFMELVDLLIEKDLKAKENLRIFFVKVTVFTIIKNDLAHKEARISDKHQTIGLILNIRSQ